MKSGRPPKDENKTMKNIGFPPDLVERMQRFVDRGERVSFVSIVIEACADWLNNHEKDI